MIEAILIILVVCGGLGFIVGVVALAILLGTSRLTLPNTNARRVMHAKTSLKVAEIRLETEAMQMRLDEAVAIRHQRALEPPPPRGTAFVKGEQ